MIEKDPQNVNSRQSKVNPTTSDRICENPPLLLNNQNRVSMRNDIIGVWPVPHKVLKVIGNTHAEIQYVEL